MKWSGMLFTVSNRRPLAFQTCTSSNPPRLYFPCIHLPYSISAHVLLCPCNFLTEFVDCLLLRCHYRAVNMFSICTWTSKADGKNGHRLVLHSAQWKQLLALESFVARTHTHTKTPSLVVSEASLATLKLVSQIQESLESTNHEKSLFQPGFHWANKHSSSHRINVVCLRITDRCAKPCDRVFWLFWYAKLPQRLLLEWLEYKKAIDVNQIEVAQ